MTADDTASSAGRLTRQAPPDFPTQSGQGRTRDSTIIATWFTESPASQDGDVADNLDLSYLIGSVATFPEVRQRRAVDADRCDSNRTIATRGL